MSYLDDPDHSWELDINAMRDPKSLELSILHLNDFGDEEAIRLVLLGYVGLKQRYPNVADKVLFDTSMIWYFG